MFVFLLAAAGNARGAIAIDHGAVGCVVAGQHPRFEARLAPAGEVSRARLHFRPAGSPHWYSVGMKLEGNVYAGVLPKPKKSLERIEYYIEATDAAFGSSRTAEYAPEVASGPAACKDRVAALALNAASVILEAPTGAPLVPVGFEPSGVLSAAAPGGASGGSTSGGSSSGGGANASPSTSW